LTRTMKIGGGVLAALLLCASLALAVAEHYTPVRPGGSDQGAAIDAHRTTFSTSDSDTAETPIDPQKVNGNTTIAVAPRFSASAATVTVDVRLYQERPDGTYVQLGIAAVQTATGSGLRRAGASGNYFTEAPLLFDTLGADVYDVRYRDVSSGTVEPWAWTFGVNSKAAE